MDVGPAKQRPRSTADVTKIDNVSLYMTATQLAVFDAFYRETLGFGSAAFEWVHPRTGNPVDARFTEAPRYTSTAPRQDGSEKYRVDMVLELMPGTEVVAPPPPPPPPPIDPEAPLWIVEPLAAVPGVEGMAWVGEVNEPDSPAPDPSFDDYLFLAGPQPGTIDDSQGVLSVDSQGGSVISMEPPVGIPIGGGAS